MRHVKKKKKKEGAGNKITTRRRNYGVGGSLQHTIRTALRHSNDCLLLCPLCEATVCPNTYATTRTSHSRIPYATVSVTLITWLQPRYIHCPPLSLSRCPSSLRVSSSSCSSLFFPVPLPPTLSMSLYQ